MPSTDRLRILLADDNSPLREGLKSLINEQADMQIVAETADGAEAIRLCAALAPNIALVDVSMPGMDGIEVASRLTRECPQVRVIALTRYKDPNFVTRMLSAGARGYVLKQSAAIELTRAIRQVAEGQQFIDPSIRPTPHARESPAAQHSGGVQDVLTPNEEQVLRLAAASYSNQEIGTRLSFDTARVAEIKASGMSKLRLATRLELVRYAVEQGWT